MCQASHPDTSKAVAPWAKEPLDPSFPLAGHLDILRRSAETDHRKESDQSHQS
jgi:hypothetical protein